MTRYKYLLAVLVAFMVQGCTDKNQDLYRADFVVKHPLSNSPLVGVPYIITAPDGTVLKGKTDKSGLTAEATSKTPGNFILTLIPSREL